MHLSCRPNLFGVLGLVVSTLTLQVLNSSNEAQAQPALPQDKQKSQPRAKQADSAAPAPNPSQFTSN
jgi:hypothetical protein